jgi:hypothetical protein
MTNNLSTTEQARRDMLVSIRAIQAQPRVARVTVETRLNPDGATIALEPTLAESSITHLEHRTGPNAAATHFVYASLSSEGADRGWHRC